MQQILQALLEMLVRMLRAVAGVGDRAARALERRLPADGELEASGSEPPAEWLDAMQRREPPAEWLAAVERREPPAQWLEYVRQRVSEVRFQHYRAASAPPSPAVRRVPAWDAPPTQRSRPVAQPRPAAAPRDAPPARQAPSRGSPRRAVRQEGALAEQSASQPEAEPDAQSWAAAESVFAAAPSPPAHWPDPTYSEAAEGGPGQASVHSAESKPSAAVRFLARAKLFLSGRVGSAPDDESPDAPVRLPDSAPHSMQWPPPEPFAEEASVLGPWPSLPDEAAPQAQPGDSSVDRLAPVDPWPSLPHIPYGAGEGSPDGDEPDVDLRALRRRQRLDDEQRGVLWNGSIY